MFKSFFLIPINKVISLRILSLSNDYLSFTPPPPLPLRPQFMGDSDNPFTYAEGENKVGKGVLSLGYSCGGQPVVVQDSEEPILLWMDR